MKYIGKLLLKDNLLSKDNLLECMVEKVESIPHLSRVVYDNKLLDIDQQLEVFKFLSENSTNYIGACKSLNIWNEKFENEILKVVEEKNKTLSEIIISKKYVSWEKLIDIFDRFFNDDKNQVMEIKGSSPNSSAEPEVNDISKFVSLYENFFNQEKFNQIEALLDGVGSGSVSICQNLNKEYEEIKSLLFEVYSSAEFIEATQSIKILGAIIDYINRIIEKSENGNEDISRLAATASVQIKKGLVLSWELRENLVASGSEISKMAPKQEVIDECIDELLNQKKKN
ncbi:MAG: hypothetical protein AB8G05_11605 [Oligoflexales bacterium]